MNKPAKRNTTDASKVSRIERRKTEFRDKITKTALRLFEKNGIAETSIASIIKEADIAHKTFFNHFPSKNHLLHHIVNSYSQHAYALLHNALMRYDDPKKRMEFCLISIAKALEPMNSQRYRDLLTFYIMTNANTKTFHDEQKENFTALINIILNDAKIKNKLRSPSDIETSSEMIVGIAISILLNWSIEENYPIVQKMKNAVKFINETIFTEI